jgi:hypothetical protein
MRKHSVRKLTSFVFLALLMCQISQAFASTEGQTTNPSNTSTSSPTSTAGGITGTDPEPIDPGIVSTILSLFGVS